MKKENGFTLVELLAVIVILAIILIIAVPGVLSIINKTKEEAYRSQLAIIKESSRNYIMAERDEIEWVTTSDYQYTYVSMDTLRKLGYLEKKLLDPRTKKPMDHYIVRVEKPETGSIEYGVLDAKDVHSVVPEGLVVHYDGIFNQGNTHQTSMVWKDLSGNNFDGILQNFSDPTVSWEQDSLIFNGIDNTVTTDETITFDGSGQHTVQFWVSDYALPQLDTIISYPIVETTGNYNIYEGAFLYSYGNELSRAYDKMNHFMFAIRKNGGYFARFAKSVATDIHSVIVVVDTNIPDLDGQMKVYLDGKLTELGNLTIGDVVHHQRLVYQPFLDARLSVGHRVGENTTPLFWKGKLYALKIYNRALSETEIQANYFMDRSRFF